MPLEIMQYDRVLLKSGHYATIVEIFEKGKAFLADIDKDGDTYTEDVSIDEILQVVCRHASTKVKYVGDAYRVSLTHGKLYEVLSIEGGWYRIIDDTGEGYLFPPDAFEITTCT